MSDNDQKQKLVEAIDKLVVYAVDAAIKTNVLDYQSVGRKFLKIARGISDLTYARDNLTREPRKDPTEV